MTPRFVRLALATFIVTALAVGYGTAMLIDRFGWHAAPILIVVCLACLAGLAAAFSKLREPNGR